MGENLKKVLFSQVNLNDSFFDSLRTDYSGFTIWFLEKSNNEAYVHYNVNNNLDGFLYLKIENNIVDDTEPIIMSEQILKIGTFKITPHGTRLGERFIKIAMDYAITKKIQICYVTVFQKQIILVNLFKKYGFIEYGKKHTKDGEELVLIKQFNHISGDIFFDYPLINFNRPKYLLSIYPAYHSIMFPDSILNNESRDKLMDEPYTNSIHKTYVCRMNGVESLKYGDILVIYRTAEEGKPAEYTSVVTSICVVENVISQYDYKNFETFYKDACKYSVFNEADLKKWYNKGGCYIIKMTYNLALKKRLTRHNLIENMNFNRNNYWGFIKIDDTQFKKILEAGEVNESIIIH